MKRRSFLGGLAAILAARRAPALCLNLRGAMMVKRGGGGGLPYVTNGLMALWDGVWNVGIGSHDSATTTWADLSGNGRDLTSLGTPDWRDNGAYVNSKANAFGNTSCAWFREQWASGAGVYVEICTKGASNYIFQFGGQQQTWQSFGFYVITINANTKRCRLNTGTTSADAAVTALVTPYRVWGWANPERQSMVFANTAQVDDTYTYQSYSGNGLCVGYRGDQYGSSAYAQGLIHRCAVYDHMLTDAEIAQNYAVDAERYGVTVGGSV